VIFLLLSAVFIVIIIVLAGDFHRDIFIVSASDFYSAIFMVAAGDFYSANFTVLPNTKISAHSMQMGVGVACSRPGGPKLKWWGLEKSRMGFQVFLGVRDARLAQNCDQTRRKNRNK